MTAPATHRNIANADELLRALTLLPPAGEFRFVDRIVQLTPGESGVGEHQVRGDEHFLRGHFPNDPLFPGVFLLEAAAQLAGVVVRSDPAAPMQELKTTALRSIKILGTARPGEVVQSEARVTGRTGHSIEVQISVRVGKEIVMTGHLTMTEIGR